MTLPLAPAGLETARLTLRPLHPDDALLHRTMWAERDPRVPPHRRIGPDGRPTVEDLAEQLRGERRTGLLTVIRTADGEALGYCGLIPDGRGPADEPELAYELLRRAHGFGYATEAARAVLGWAAETGYRRVWAGVRVWNIASLRVLRKVGFVDSGQDEPDAEYGDSLVMVRTLGTLAGRGGSRPN